jgi:ABC-2 type transport system permease protein
MGVTTGTMVGATMALSAMALTYGAMFPNYDTENVAEIPTSFGGLMFMMTGVIYLGLIVLFEAWPVYRFLASHLPGAPAPQGLGAVTLGLMGAGVLTAVVIVVALRQGVRSVAEMAA